MMNPSSRASVTICKFCQSNGESEAQYSSHTLKNGSGLVTCPVLRNLVCTVCRATGDFAHTIRYCPLNKDGKYTKGASLIDLKKKKNAAGNIPTTKLTWPLPSNYTKIFSSCPGFGSYTSASPLVKAPAPSPVKLATDLKTQSLPTPALFLDMDYYRHNAPPPLHVDPQPASELSHFKHYQSIQYHRAMEARHQEQLAKLQKLRQLPCYSRRFSASPPRSIASSGSDGSPPQQVGKRDSLSSLLTELRAGSEEMDMF